MKKIKIKMELEFMVPNDTVLFDRKEAGIFIVNKKHGIDCTPIMEGWKCDSYELTPNGEFVQSRIAPDYDNFYNFLTEIGHPTFEKTIIKIGKDEKIATNIYGSNPKLKNDK